MIQLFTGPFRAIEPAAVDHLLALRDQDPWKPVLVLSPSGKMLTRLQSELSRRRDGLLNIHFLTFYALADRLLLDGPARSDRVIRESALYREIIRDLLNGQSDVEWTLRRDLYAPEHDLPRGLPGALAETLKDLRDSGARVVDSLSAALEGHLGEAGPDTAPTLELYARTYEVLQKHHLRTPADHLRRAGEQASRHPWLQSLAGMVVYGVYDLTGVQLDFLLSLASVPNSRLYCPYEPDHHAYSYADRLVKDPAFLSKVSTVVTLTDQSPSPEVDVWSCSGAADEAWLAAKTILARHDAGIAYGDMAILARALGPYAGVLRAALETHHIPYAMSHEEPVGSYPLIKVARQWLRLKIDDYPLEAVFDVLGSPYSRSGINDVHRWATAARIAGVTGGFIEWKNRLAGEPDMAPLLTLLQRMDRDLADSGFGSWVQQVEWAKKTIQDWLALPLDAELPERLLWDGLMNALDGLRDLNALERDVTRERFLEVVDEKLHRLTMTLAPVNNAGIQVFDVMTSRGLRFKDVILLGMNEKSFPRLIREDPFLSDQTRSALSSALGCRLSRNLDGYQEERLLFYLTTQSVSERLTVTYQRSDEEGKALIPSLYLQDLFRSGAKTHYLPRSASEKWLQTPAERLTAKEASMVLNREKRDAAALYNAFGLDAERYQSLCQSQELIEQLNGSRGERDGLVGPLNVSERAHTVTHSAESLKLLAECPFRYFANKLLDLRSIQTVFNETSLASDASGKLIHRILESFYQHMAKRKQPYGELEWEIALENALQFGFAAPDNPTRRLFPLVRRATEIAIRSRLRKFLKADLQEMRESGFRPTFFEVEARGVLNELVAPLNTVPFKGRIDRIDVRERSGASEYRVVDYKTGHATPGMKTETAILRGKHLQLPIYMSLAKTWLAEKARLAVGPGQAMFYNLADWEKGYESPSLDPSFWQAHGAAFSENIHGLLSLVENGHFYIRPGEGEFSHCSFCPYDQLCRKEHKPSALRSEQLAVRQANDERLKRVAS